MSRLWFIAIVSGVVVLSGISRPAAAQFTPEHRKELTELSKEVSRASGLIRKKEFDEAQKTLTDVETRLQAVVTASKLPANTPAIRRIVLLLEKQQAALAKADDRPKPEVAAVSFMKEIAPIIVSRCVQCHGENNPRNGLRLDRFSGWRAGGKNGPVLIPEHASRSLMMARVNASEGNGRMPANGAPLTDEQKKDLAAWIDQGARFDGAAEDRTFADLIYEQDAKNVKIPMPKGGETVSFKTDIAPWFANLCLNCHNSRRKSGGLSVETFFDIMKGGESGEVVIPGDMENSRLFRLVGGLELPRMPQGQARITRKNYEDLKKWFAEGNVYDGGDPRTPIASLIPSEAQMAQQGIASLSDAELQKLRIERSEEQYRKAISSEAHPTLMDDQFLLLGNVEEKRLAQVQGWAHEQLEILQKAFDHQQKPWRGRLAIFVLKDQFSYSEFNQVVERRRVDASLTGHSKITTGQEDAYVVLLDTGDQPENALSLQVSLMDNLTGAYLQKSGRSFPEWVVRGAGLVMADSILPDRRRVESLEKAAPALVAVLDRPEDIFKDGALAPSAAAPVGYTIVKFLTISGGPAKFSQFIKALDGGANVNAALQSTYGASPATIATGYLSKLKSR